MMYENGEQPPPAFFDQPEVQPHLSFVWLAFHELGTERLAATSPIPASKIREYADRELWLSTDREEWFVELIRLMDAESLNNFAERVRVKSKKEPENVPANDPAATRQLFSSLKAKASAKKRGG